MKACANKQHGAALLAMLAVMILGSSWWLVSALSTPANRVALEAEHNARVLAEAKSALLGYVAQRALLASENHPGRLPCPEPGGHVGNASYEGITAPYPTSGELACTNIGRLPWRTLGLDKLRDAAGEPLWYAVTIGANGWALQDSTTVLSINSNKAGQVLVDAQMAVAVIIAPGRPMNLSPNANQLAAGCAARVQNRTAVPPDYRDYLECHNLAAPAFRTWLVDNATNPAFNDQLVVITAAEVMAAIEGAVAARILRDVVPQLATVYNSSDWSASATDPIFPYAAPFANSSTSPFKGVAGTREGLLPLTRAQNCDPATDNRCDPNFVQWDTSSISVSKDGGTGSITSSNCTASTPSLISCTITFERTCFLCSATLEARIRADGLKVAMAFKTLNAAVITGTTSTTQFTAPIRSDASGSARIDYRGWLPNIPLCIGSCSATRTVTIPITALKDHPLVSPATTDAWYWFIANNWHHVTYYAVSPSHLADDQDNCSADGDCLTVTGGNPSVNLKALVILAGRSLTSAARPNANLNDYLDTAENRDGDRLFEQNKVGRTFNDRFIAISNY